MFQLCNDFELVSMHYNYFAFIGTVTREKCVTKSSSNKLSRGNLGPSMSTLGMW